MKNNRFSKNKSAIGKIVSSKIVKKLLGFYKAIFAKRTFMIVGKKKIKTINIGAIPQIIAICFLVWLVNFFVKSAHYNEMVDEKTQEIEKLKTVNSYFEEEFRDTNERLVKVNEYLISINGQKRNVKADEGFKKPKKLNQDALSKQEKHTLNELKEVNAQLANIQYITQDRIKKIEKAIEITGLNMKKIELSKFKSKEVKEISLNDKKDFKALKAQGGPFVIGDSFTVAADNLFSRKELSERKFERNKFKSDIDYLIVLEKLVTVLPFAKPMKNYFISSGFGTRADPLTSRHASHEGLDFVGPNKEKIIAPSKGVVVLAGRFSDYGNAIVIDHGFGITTRYGHLSEVRVEKGQKVSQGDVIALQGSTGRSTGSHLHYEVRYKNIPLNPKRFLEAGRSINNEDRVHVNS
jgi:murein DD-endopeptidase MepM/ murein hydrolase activator NlpD